MICVVELLLFVVGVGRCTPMATTVASSCDECLKPGIGKWLLNKLLKQTFYLGKISFF